MRIAIVDQTESRAAVVEEGLREAGVRDIVRIAAHRTLVAELEGHSPDVVIFDLGSPSRDTLQEVLAVSRALARPIAMFVDTSDDEMIGAAIEAGVSAYVVDGLKKERVKPIVDLAVRRFNAFAAVQKELEQAKTALAERRIIDRAKLYLMSTRKLTEANAYALLRGTAMRQGKRIAEIAQALVTAAELLESKPEGKPGDDR
ncbi:MAG TPA: ANTAR domain-containing protein [Sphingomicrobium sp.]|nr:ANTAR domain-containing protein [Sphingomicrobium sp.]